jgi:predicted house-cleaning noncanonical NTP pyrophosphatase (MazG superfamily)
MDVPVEIIDQLGRASRLAIPERVEAMKKLNQKLMEYLDNVGQDPGIRQ